MRSISPALLDDSDSAKTLPVGELAPESGRPAPGSWDSEAPTAVHALRPLFAGPPRLPTT